MRSVGIVLISAMLIAPAVAARQFVKSLDAMFMLSGFLGLSSGLLGVILSVELTHKFTAGAHFALPTGPMIVLVACSIAIVSLLFSPKTG
jgi:manganese/zinc/iron transport system permease protein